MLSEKHLIIFPGRALLLKHITKTYLPNIFQSVFIHIVYTAIFRFNPLTPNNNSPYCLPYQGCALTAPGRLRRLTFGLGRLKILSWSPGRATGWCWFLDLQSKKKKKMLFNRARVDIQRCNIIIDFDRDKLHSFRF